MSIRQSLCKVLALYLVVALVSFAPISAIQQAARAIGLKQLLVGGLVGAAGLLALGALAGPAGAIGAAGCAGTSFLGVLGGALGTLVSGVTGITSAMGTLSMSSMATLGLMIGGAALGIMGLMGTSFVAVPALVLGAGLCAWFFGKSNLRYGQPYDQRNDGLINDPFFNAGARLGNQSTSGYRGGTDGTLADRVRSIFDRDRRDDSFFSTNRYVDANGYVRTGTDIWSRIDRFFNGRNSGYGGGVQGYPYGTYGTVGSSPAFTYGTGSRTGLQPGAPETTTPAPADEDLIKAQAERQAAYERLLKALQAQEQDGTSTGVGTAPGFQSKEVQQAIREYRDADRLLKEITGRLQHQEKQ